jgi:hypothetical protein
MFSKHWLSLLLMTTISFGVTATKLQAICTCSVHTLYRIFPSITHALSIQKRSVNEKNGDARYAMKIEKIPNHLHTYVHNNLKQRISGK